MADIRNNSYFLFDQFLDFSDFSALSVLSDLSALSVLSDLSALSVLSDLSALSFLFELCKLTFKFKTLSQNTYLSFEGDLVLERF